MAHQASNLSSPGALKLRMVLLGMSLAIYILGSHLYWQLEEGLASVRRVASFPSCTYDFSAKYMSTIPPGILQT